MRIRERTKRNASGYSSGSDISDLDLSSPASIDGIVANVNRQLKRWKVGEKRSKCEVDTAGGAEKESASGKSVEAGEVSATGSSETPDSEMAGKTAENGGVTAENALITYFKCAVKNKFGPLAGQQDNESIMDVEMPSAETDSVDLGDSAPEPSQAKQVKPPPLCFPTRLREKYGAFRKMLNAVSAEYHIQFAGDSTLVYFKAKTDYDKFVQQHKNSVPFYTYTPKGQKTNAYVIKGLHEDVEESDVKNELLELGIEVSAVTRFKRSKYPIFVCG